ncbi:hypothetical protein G6F57_023257 [Rhizopus arrhizus]|nr:hypothetical protein G6F57_023257 [Rhizopus arrhizus]
MSRIVLTSILLSKTVEGVVRFSFLTNETTESVGGESVGIATISVDITNVDLNGSVVLGSNETVGGRAKIE